MRHLPFVCFVLVAARQSGLLDKDIILAALHDARIQKSKMKVHAGIDPCLFDRQLDGEGYLKHETLLKLGVSFRQWYCVRTLMQIGLPQEVKRGLPITLAILTQKRMARMALTDQRHLAARKEA